VLISVSASPRQRVKNCSSRREVEHDHLTSDERWVHNWLYAEQALTTPARGTLGNATPSGFQV
jgi:hypothetical protein